MKKASVVVLVVAAAVLLPARASAVEPAPEPASLELEMQILGRPAVSGGLVSSGAGGRGLIGLPLGQRAVLMTGLEVSGGVWNEYESWYLSAPLLLKVYLRAPAERRLVPVLRLGIGYARSSWSQQGQWGGSDDSVSHDVEASGVIGVTYFITRQLGLGMNAGIGYSHRLGYQGCFPGAESAWSVQALWQTSLVLRL